MSDQKQDPTAAPPKKGLQYFEYDGMPAYIAPGQVPHLVDPDGGDDQPMFEVSKFYQEATPITSAEYHKMTKGASEEDDS